MYILVSKLLFISQGKTQRQYCVAFLMAFSTNYVLNYYLFIYLFNFGLDIQATLIPISIYNIQLTLFIIFGILY